MKPGIQSNLIDIYNANNISAAISIGTYFKIRDSKIKDAIESYFPNNNRSQLIEKGSNKIIMDAYNANPSSMAAALENLLQLKDESKMAILGDMFELGDESLTEHHKIIQMLNEKDLDIYFIGKDFFANKNNNPHMRFFEDFDSFNGYFKNIRPINKTILIKGSRGMALEKTLELL